MEIIRTNLFEEMTVSEAQNVDGGMKLAPIIRTGPVIFWPIVIKVLRAWC